MDSVIIKVLKKTNTFGLIGHKGVSSLLAFGLKKMNKIFNCLIMDALKSKPLSMEMKNQRLSSML